MAFAGFLIMLQLCKYGDISLDKVKLLLDEL